MAKMLFRKTLGGLPVEPALFYEEQGAMFSVQQKREISGAVQRILRETNHPELPKEGEITFCLVVRGEAAWSFAEIFNNASVPNPGVNPHNESQDPRGNHGREALT